MLKPINYVMQFISFYSIFSSRISLLVCPNFKLEQQKENASFGKLYLLWLVESPFDNFTLDFHNGGLDCW